MVTTAEAARDGLAWSIERAGEGGLLGVGRRGVCLETISARLLHSHATSVSQLPGEITVAEAIIAVVVVVARPGVGDGDR